MRRLTIMLLTVGALLWATSAIAYSDDRYQVTTCTSSGRGDGDLVEVTRAGQADGFYVAIVGLDRKPTTYILVLPGETWQVTDGQQVIASETVDLSDCDGDTTTPPPDTTTPPDDTTTTAAPPDDTTTTTTQPDDDVTTTTQPGRPPRGEDCPEDQHEIGRQGAQRLCAADAEGG